MGNVFLVKDQRVEEGRDELAKEERIHLAYASIWSSFVLLLLLL
jgi:hypothetical protein